MYAYYEEGYLNKMRTVDRNYAKVTKADLIEIRQDDKYHRFNVN
jgi:hypothetical protein